MWKHKQDHRPATEDELRMSPKVAPLPKLPAACFHDEAGSRMSDEGCPNEAFLPSPRAEGARETRFMRTGGASSEE